MTKEEWQLTNVPVVILPKMDHSSFCPGFKVPGDVYPADSTQEEAMEATGATVSAFLDLHSGANGEILILKTLENS